MKKRICAIALVFVLAISFVLPCAAASVPEGSGTKDDPYQLSSVGTLYVLDDGFVLPGYFYAAAPSSGSYAVYTHSLVFTSGETYYLYFPVSVPYLSLYVYSSPSNSSSQTLVLEYSSDNWKVYSFVANIDGYGFYVNSSSTGFTFYFDTSLHEPVEFGKVAKQVLGGVLDVGSQFVSWVVGTPLLLVAFTIMVTVTGVGIIRRITKGV